MLNLENNMGKPKFNREQLLSTLNDFRKSPNPMDFERSADYFNFNLAPKTDIDGQPIPINKWSDEQINNYADAMMLRSTPSVEASATSTGNAPTITNQQPAADPSRRDLRRTARQERRTNRLAARQERMEARQQRRDARYDRRMSRFPESPNTASGIVNPYPERMGTMYSFSTARKQLMDNGFSREQADRAILNMQNAYNQPTYNGGETGDTIALKNLLDTIHSWVPGTGRLPQNKEGGILKRVNKYQFGGNTPMVNPMYQFNAMDRNENGNPNEHHWWEYLMPGYGTMLSTNDYMNKPSFGNFISAALSGIGDFFGLKGLNALRGAKALGKEVSMVGKEMGRSGLDFDSVYNGWNSFYDHFRKNGILIGDTSNAAHVRMSLNHPNIGIDKSSELYRSLTEYASRMGNGDPDLARSILQQGEAEILSKVLNVYDDFNKTVSPYYKGLELSDKMADANKAVKVNAGAAAAADAASAVGKNGGSR